MPRVRRGQQLGGWRLAARLGAGGNGEVWHCTRIEGGSAAAIKILSEPRNTERRARFLQEIEFLRRHGSGKASYRSWTTTCLTKVRFGM